MAGFPACPSGRQECLPHTHHHPKARPVERPGAFWFSTGSSSSPLYFPPDVITLGRQRFEFLDGGITAYNNPALIAYLTATQPCYHIDWPTGTERLHLVSVGTDQTRARVSERLRRLLGTFGLATAVPASLMDSISREQDLLCRTLGHTLHGAPMDSEATEIQGLRHFTYARFNREFTAAEIAAAEKAHGGRFSLDNLDMIQHLITEGHRFAEQMQTDHVI